MTDQFLGISIFIWIIFAILIIVLLGVYFWNISAYRNIHGIFRNLQKYRYFSRTISFFKGTADLITIIGTIVAIISLSPLFLTFILGEDWFHILLTSPSGIQALDAIIIATYLASFFIYCILVLIFIQWINKILLSNEVRKGEKLFSFTILIGGIIATACLVWFLVMVWITRHNIPISLFVLTAGLFLFVLAFLLLISGLIDLTSYVEHSAFRGILFVLIFILFLTIVATIAYPAITSNAVIYNIASEYTAIDKHNFSFKSVPLWSKNDSPVVISLQPNFTDYPNDSINLDYLNCHWSTNYGYFFTINSNTSFVKKQTNEFIIPKCIQNPEENIYWTYDFSDYSKNKSSTIISLQIENSNKKSLNENLGENIDYIVGNAHSNFTWINDTIIETNKSIFY